MTHVEVIDLMNQLAAEKARADAAEKRVEELSKVLSHGASRSAFHVCKYPTDGCWVCEARAILARREEAKR